MPERSALRFPQLERAMKNQDSGASDRANAEVVSSSRRRGRTVALVGLALVIVAGVVAVRFALSRRAPAVEPPPQASAREVLGIGLLESVQEVPLAFETAGRIA